MTVLSLACVNMLLQTPEIQALVASGKLGRGGVFPEGWIFDSRPYTALEPLSHKAFVVVSQGRPWNSPNVHNTAKFPTLYVDIWAAPTKGPDREVISHDADNLIEEIGDAIRPYLHTVNSAVPGIVGDPSISYLGAPGGYRMWGTAEEVSTGVALPVVSSQQLNGPDFSPVADGGEGSRMGTYEYGVIL